MQTLGEQIEAARGRANLTRMALAVAVRVDPQTIYRWERAGQRPSDANLDAIAKTCGCSFFGPQLILPAQADSATE